jgi:hypothetical protein
MKKCLIAFLLPFFFYACSCVSKRKISQENKITPEISLREKYKVYKIDSIKNVYLIYAQKDSTLYKIVSLKDSLPCNRVQVGGEYAFVLMSTVAKDFKGVDVSPSTIPHITGISFYGTWIEFESDSINDIYTSINLRGLCIQ